MQKESRSLAWVTPAKYVGPAMVIIWSVSAALAGWFAFNTKFNEAIIALLFAVSLLLVGIVDLLGELIMQGARKAQPPDA